MTFASAAGAAGVETPHIEEIELVSFAGPLAVSPLGAVEAVGAIGTLLIL